MGLALLPVTGPEPWAFVATTETAYVMPSVSPETMQVNGFGSTPTVVEQDALPGLKVTEYPVTGDPPSLVGAAHEIVARPFPATAVTFVGALGAPTGVAVVDPTLDGESPLLFVAPTVKVYEVPFVRPVQFAVTPVTTHDAPEGDDVTV